MINMIIEQTNPATINRIMNDKTVAEAAGIQPGEYADFTDSIGGPDFYYLSNIEETALSIHERKVPGIWEGHVAFLPGCRGRIALELGVEMLRHMRDVKGAQIIYSQVSINNPRARWFCRQMGMKSQGHSHQELVGIVEVFRIVFQDIPGDQLATKFTK